MPVFCSTQTVRDDDKHQSNSGSFLTSFFRTVLSLLLARTEFHWSSQRPVSSFSHRQYSMEFTCMHSTTVCEILVSISLKKSLKGLLKSSLPKAGGSTLCTWMCSGDLWQSKTHEAVCSTHLSSWMRKMGDLAAIIPHISASLAITPIHLTPTLILSLQLAMREALIIWHQLSWLAWSQWTRGGDWPLNTEYYTYIKYFF